MFKKWRSMKPEIPSRKAISIVTLTLLLIIAAIAGGASFYVWNKGFIASQMEVVETQLKIQDVYFYRDDWMCVTCHYYKYCGKLIYDPDEFEYPSQHVCYTDGVRCHLGNYGFDPWEAPLEHYIEVYEPYGVYKDYSGFQDYLIEPEKSNKYAWQPAVTIEAHRTINDTVKYGEPEPACTECHPNVHDEFECYNCHKYAHDRAAEYGPSHPHDRLIHTEEKCNNAGCHRSGPNEPPPHGGSAVTLRIQNIGDQRIDILTVHVDGQGYDFYVVYPDFNALEDGLSPKEIVELRVLGLSWQPEEFYEFKVVTTRGTYALFEIQAPRLVQVQPEYTLIDDYMWWW